MINLTCDLCGRDIRAGLIHPQAPIRRYAYLVGELRDGPEHYSSTNTMTVHIHGDCWAAAINNAIEETTDD